MRSSHVGFSRGTNINTLKKIAIAAILTLSTFTASAEVVCRGCSYGLDAAATYLGAYWLGDGGSLIHENIAADYGSSQSFNDYWVFDLNDTGNLNLAIERVTGTAFAELLEAELFVDTGSICSSEAGQACSVLAVPFGSNWFSLATEYRKNFVGVNGIPPGRYVLRVGSSTRAVGESSYKVTLKFQKTHVFK